MSNPYKHINLGYLESITDGNNELIKELIAIFIEQVPEFNEGFEKGIEEKDWNQIAAVAHKAKSSVISMGMDKLGNTDLKNLELLAKLLLLDDLKSKSDDEVMQLKKSIDSYPEDRRSWLLENKNENTIKSIIDHFNDTCKLALSELKSVLEN